MKKLKPEEAWLHIKALWPTATSIENATWTAIVIVGGRRIMSSLLADAINWGDLKEYPPAPGDGWILLGKYEPVKEGDEYFDDGEWRVSNNHRHCGRQSDRYPYRRRVPPEIRPYTFNQIVQCIANGYDETCCGYIVGVNQNYVTFKKNDITETRALSDTSDITWVDGKPFGEEVKP